MARRFADYVGDLMPRSNHSVLVNAFRPAREVDDPNFFAGRSRQIADLTDALHVDGSTPLIYGARGLGKTSLALQMSLIAQGGVQLLSAQGTQEKAFNETDRYVVFLVTCTDATRNFDGLLQELTNAAEEADFPEAQSNYRAKHLAERTMIQKLSFKIVEIQRSKKFIPEKTRRSYRNLSPTERLQHLIRLILEAYHRPILFIIDEIDRLQDTQGLASFIKATSDDQVKFALVGISSSIGDLLADHRSIERTIWPVHVPRMEEDELGQIIWNAQRYLYDHGQQITFDRMAISHIVGSAEGFPWIVHVLGQTSLLRGIEAHRNVVASRDVLDTIYELPRNRFAQQFTDAYSNVVRGSAQREIVLKAFAYPRTDYITTSEIYQILKTKLGVKNPSSYKTQLSSPEFGSVIYTPVGRHRGDACFSDPIFKIYVSLRPSIHKDVDKMVRAAFSLP
jgi:Cdc6-like AAA superfamily ATPase